MAYNKLAHTVVALALLCEASAFMGDVYMSRAWLESPEVRRSPAFRSSSRRSTSTSFTNLNLRVPFSPEFLELRQKAKQQQVSAPVKIVQRPVMSASTLSAPEAKKELLSLLSGTTTLGKKESAERASQIDGLVDVLASSGLNKYSEDIDGEWALVMSRNAKGSPSLQKASNAVERLGGTFQNFRVSAGAFDNFADVLGGKGRLYAGVEYKVVPEMNGSRISADIVDAYLEIWKFKIPLPLRVKGGWLDFLYVDKGGIGRLTGKTGHLFSVLVLILLSGGSQSWAHHHIHHLPQQSPAKGVVNLGGVLVGLRLRGGWKGRYGMPIASLSDIKREGDGDDIPAGMEGPVDGEKMSKFFMGLYHEKQIGGLCAVHCLNNLLQEPAYDEIFLAELGQDIDRQERQAFGGASLDGESGNVRADGFFSVQVIQQALQKHGLQCIPFGSADAKSARDNPVKEVGFICNRSEHWFALRRVGPFWFDLNSTMQKPRFISDTLLSMTLAQSKEAGYSVFVVRGVYPPCDIERDKKRLDAVMQACKDGPAGQVSGGVSKASGSSTSAFSGQGHSLAGSSSAPASDAVAAALAAAGVDPNADPELAAAIAASIQDAQPSAPAVDPMEEMRRKRLARFG